MTSRASTRCSRRAPTAGLRDDSCANPRAGIQVALAPAVAESRTRRPAGILRGLWLAPASDGEGFGQNRYTQYLDYLSYIASTMPGWITTILHIERAMAPPADADIGRAAQAARIWPRNFRFRSRASLMTGQRPALSRPSSLSAATWPDASRRRRWSALHPACRATPAARCRPDFLGSRLPCSSTADRNRPRDLVHCPDGTCRQSSADRGRRSNGRLPNRLIWLAISSSPCRSCPGAPLTSLRRRRILAVRLPGPSLVAFTPQIGLSCDGLDQATDLARSLRRRHEPFDSWPRCSGSLATRLGDRVDWVTCRESSLIEDVSSPEAATA